MFSNYERDSEISKEDIISFEDISEIKNYGKFLLRRASTFDPLRNIWKSKADIFDLFSLKDMKKNPLTRKQLTGNELYIIKWKIENVNNIQDILKESKSKDFDEGFNYCLGKIEEKYPNTTFLDLISVKEKNRYIEYVLDNIKPEDLSCYYDIKREETRDVLKDSEIGSWLIRPSSIKAAEVIESDGKEYEAGKVYVISIKRDEKTIKNHLLCYLRSLGYVFTGDDFKDIFENLTYPTIGDALRSRGLIL